jgi:multicomponent Na+:H+ antiporter subunit D
LLLFAGFAFFVLLPMMKRTLTISLDFDWFYRRFAKVVGDEFSVKTGKAFDRLETQVRSGVTGFVQRLHRHHGPQGILARTWPSGAMVLWVAVMLVASLVLYYV